MCAYLEDPDGAPQLIAEVTTTGVDWDPQGLQLLKCPTTAAANYMVLKATKRYR